MANDKQQEYVSLTGDSKGLEHNPLCEVHGFCPTCKRESCGVYVKEGMGNKNFPVIQCLTTPDGSKPHHKILKDAKKFCMECGKELAIWAKFCNKCGKPQVEK